MTVKDRRVLQEPMPRARENPRDDVTAELTGSDANFGEASVGGLGPDRPDAYRDSVENDDTGLRLEADPAHAEDISPDQNRAPPGRRGARRGGARDHRPPPRRLRGRGAAARPQPRRGAVTSLRGELAAREALVRPGRPAPNRVAFFMTTGRASDGGPPTRSRVRVEIRPGSRQTKRMFRSQAEGPAGLDEALAGFHPIVAGWFQETLGEPSAPQRQGWPLIARGARRADRRADRLGQDARRVPRRRRSALPPRARGRRSPDEPTSSTSRR